MASPDRPAPASGAAPRIVMAACLAAFVIAVVALVATGTTGHIVVFVGLAVLVSCAISCVWAWRLSVRHDRAMRGAVRDLLEQRRENDDRRAPGGR